MANALPLVPCDGCGQLADAAHISRRLRRLEWATRYRPIHIQSLLVSGISPQNDDEFFYSPQAAFQGEAGNILAAASVSTQDRTPESVQSEFQKRGLMLIHVLDCPFSTDSAPFEPRPVLEKQLSATITRIRRSLKPKRVLLISAELAPLAGKFLAADLRCPVFPSTSDTFLGSEESSESEWQAFRAALVNTHVQTA